MRFGMRFHDRDLYEKECEERENGGLDEAHEELKHHDGDRRHVGQEENDDENQDLAGKNVAKKTKREGNDAHDLGEKLDDADEKANETVAEIDEFACIFPKTNDQDTSNFDDEK